MKEKEEAVAERIRYQSEVDMIVEEEVDRKRAWKLSHPLEESSSFDHI